MKLLIQKGATSYSVVVHIRDTSVTTGAGLTGLAYNTSGLTAYYHRMGSSPVQITLATQTVNGAFSSGGFVAIDGTNMPGMYRLDIPDAALASGVNQVTIMLKGAANMEQCPLEIQLVSYNPNDAVRMGLTALPNANAEAAGGLYTRGTGAGQIDQPANGRIAADAVAISGDSTAADNAEAMFDGTGYAGGTIKLGVDAVAVSGDAAAADNLEAAYDGNGYAGGTTKQQVDLVLVRGVQPNNLISGRMDVNVGGMQADVLTASAVAADAIGASELAADAATEIANAILAKVVESEGSYTVQQVLSITLAVLAGVTSNGGNTLKSPNGVATRVSATTDGSNNRTAMNLTPSA